MFDTICGLHKRARVTPGVHPGDPALVDILGLRGETTSGIQVDRCTSLGYPAFWRGINLISSGVGKLPLFIFKNLPGGGKERDKNHPAYEIVRRKPNDEMLALDFRQTLQAHALMYGNGYAALQKTQGGELLSMVPLLPDRTFPVREDTILRYITRVDNKDFVLLPSQVIHIKGLSWNGITGYSVIEVLAEALGLGLATQKFGSAFFGNGIHADGIMMYPNKLGPEARENLRSGWDKFHKGTGKSFRMLLLEEGIKFQQLTIPPEHAQFIETRGFEVRQVANILGLPPHKLGDDSRTSFNSLEQENRSYLQDALEPWLCKWEEEFRDKVLSEEEKQSESHTIEFVRDALLRPDAKTEVEVMTAELNNGMVNLDEIRAVKNRPPLPDGEGKKFRKPINIGIIGETPPAPVAPFGNQPDTDDDDTRQRLLGEQRAVVVDAIGRAIRRLAVHARRAAKQPGTFLASLDALESEHGVVVSEMLQPGVRACAVLGDFDSDKRVEALSGELFGSLRSTLLEAAGKAKMNNLSEVVDDVLSVHEEHGAESVAELLVRRQTVYSAATT